PFFRAFEALKNAAAWRKDFFDTLSARRNCFPPGAESVKKGRAFHQRGGRVCAGNPGRVSCTMMIPIFQSF
ncbi:MAG: hypothetical protein ACLVGM_02235, partial [Oscillospiraceae bacterium]